MAEEKKESKMTEETKKEMILRKTKFLMRVLKARTVTNVSLFKVWFHNYFIGPRYV